MSSSTTVDTTAQPRGALAAEAVTRWRTLGGAVPASVVPVQEERSRSLYRLVGAAGEGADVIAKRCPGSEADREQTIYETLTSCCPGISVELYGRARSEGKYDWLFLQDAAGRTFHLGDMHDRAVAGRWLGQLHALGADMPGASSLRDRGPEHFVEYLDIVPHQAARASRNPELGDTDRHSIDYTVDVCARVRSQWDRVRSFCATMPPTFVFGDFKDDNVRVIDSDRGPTLVGFDWNEAGWGVPALDVLTFAAHRVAPLLSEYLPVVMARWPAMTAERILLLGVVGEIFRCGASMRWELHRLEWPWTAKAMALLRHHNDWMDRCIQRVPWLR